MIYVAMLLLAYVTLTAIIQGWIVTGFVRKLFAPKSELQHFSDVPKAAVVLAVAVPIHSWKSISPHC